jgi:hypothetical protein
MADKRHTETGQRDKEPVINPMAVIAAGLSSVTAATVTSRFGVAETLIGGALTAMISATGPVVFKSYLDQLDNATKGTRILQSIVRARAALKWFSSLPSEGRRPILFSGLLAGVVAFLLGMGTVTAAELGAGKSLPCWVWDNCPQDASEGTLPSIVGGGPSDGGLSIFRDDPGDAGSRTTVEVEDVEQPSAAAESENYILQPVVAEDAEEYVEPSTTTDDGKGKGSEKSKPCGGNETTGGASQTTVDGKSKRPKSCDGKQGGTTNPKPPESGKEQRGGVTTQGGDNCSGVPGPCREESTVQGENPPVKKEEPPLEQPRRGADEQDHGPPLEVTGLSKGGV